MATLRSTHAADQASAPPAVALDLSQPLSTSLGTSRSPLVSLASPPRPLSLHSHSGTAGLVLANRLSAQQLRVGVIDTGSYNDSEFGDPVIDIPYGASIYLQNPDATTYGNPNYDWGFVSVPQLAGIDSSVDISTGKRCYAAPAYYNSTVRVREILSMLIGALASRIVWNNSTLGSGNITATGVEYIVNGTTYVMSATREVILSAGMCQVND